MSGAWSVTTIPCVRRRSQPRHLVVASIVGISGLGVPGCQKALFPENAPRTQFEAYEIMRQRYVPLEEPDVFGTPRPAIRARLTPER